MKDYNYYKTISDICNEANDVYKKYKIEKIIPQNKISLNKEIDEGDSFLLISGDNKYLMVETSTDFCWVSSRLMLKYYTSELIIEAHNKFVDSEIINQIYKSYDGFKLEIPKWYNR